MTLAEFVSNLERRAREAEAMQAAAPVAVVLRSVLADLEVLNNENGGNGTTPPVAPPDRLLTVEETANRMGVRVEWLYRHARRLPFARHLGRRTLRFSESGLARYLERVR